MASCAQLVYQEGLGHRGAASHLVMCVFVQVGVQGDRGAVSDVCHCPQALRTRRPQAHRSHTQEREKREKRCGKPLLVTLRPDHTSSSLSLLSRHPDPIRPRLSLASLLSLSLCGPKRRGWTLGFDNLPYMQPQTLSAWSLRPRVARLQASVAYAVALRSHG